MKKQVYLYHCRLIPELSGSVGSENGSVLLEDGKIQGVWETSSPEAHQEAAGVDCQGKTLLPGFLDVHTHLTGLRGFGPEQLKDPMKFFYKTLLFAESYLDYGFTTIRDCGAFLRVANKVRDAFAEGLGTGPRVLAGGLILMPTEDKEDDPIYDMYVHADGAEEWRRAARKELAEQADFVKIMASGSAFDRYGIPKQAILTREELQAAVDVARRKHSYIAAHAHADEVIRMCVEEQARTIEHASFIGTKSISLLKETKDVWLVPTVAAFYQNPDTTPPQYQYLIQKLKDMLAISAGCLKEAYEAGCPMAFGTDSCPGMDQYEKGIEFQYRYEICGVKPLDILKQATVESARALGIEKETGEIKAGLDGDLVLINGKPETDISCLYGKPEAVWRAGVQVRGAERRIR